MRASGVGAFLGGGDDDTAEVPLRRGDSAGAGVVSVAAHPVTGRADAIFLEKQIVVGGSTVHLDFRFVQEQTTFSGVLLDYDLARTGAFTHVETSSDSRWLLVAGGSRLETAAMASASNFPAACCAFFDLELLASGQTNLPAAGTALFYQPIVAVHWNSDNVFGVLLESGVLELKEVDPATNGLGGGTRKISLTPGAVDFAFVPVAEDPARIVLVALDGCGSVDLHLSDRRRYESAASAPPLRVFDYPENEDRSTKGEAEGEVVVPAAVSVAVLHAGELCIFAVLREDGKVYCVGCSGAALLMSYTAFGASAPFVLDQLQVPVRDKVARKLTSVTLGTAPLMPSVLVSTTSEVFLLQFPWLAQLAAAGGGSTSAKGLLGPPPLMPTTVDRLVTNQSLICGVAATKTTVWTLRGNAGMDLATLSGLQNSADWQAIDKLEALATDVNSTLVTRITLSDFNRTMEELWRAAADVPDSVPGEAPTTTMSVKVAQEMVNQFIQQLKAGALDSNHKFFNLQGSAATRTAINGVLTSLEVSAAKIGRIVALVSSLQTMTQRLNQLSPTVPVPERLAKNWDALRTRITRTEQSQAEIQKKAERVIESLNARIEEMVALLIQSRYTPVFIEGSEHAAAQIATMLATKYGG